jgi:hypothetical protein
MDKNRLRDALNDALEAWFVEEDAKHAKIAVENKEAAKVIKQAEKDAGYESSAINETADDPIVEEIIEAPPPVEDPEDIIAKEKAEKIAKLKAELEKLEE